MSKGNVLITEIIHPILEEQLTQAGWSCLHIEKISYAEVLDKISSYDGLVVRSKIKVDKALIDKGEKLKFIGRAGSGMELIDVSYAQQKGIQCISAPEGNRDAVAEQALGMLMGLMHHIVRGDRSLRQKLWKRKENTGDELMGKTVGIIGFGNTGQAFAKRLKGFEVKVLAYDKYQSINTDLGAYITAASLQHIFEQADVLSLHIPLNEETRYWIDGQFIQQFHKPIYLLNTSRGGILHTTEVLKALEANQLKGLGLDVFENEDMQAFSENDWNWFEKLIQQENLVMTPHTAGVTQQSAYKVAYVLSEKIKEVK